MAHSCSIAISFIFQFLQTFSLAASNYMLVALAVDRHQAVRQPMVLPPRPLLLPCLAWAAALLPSLPVLFIFEVESRPHGGEEILECVSNFNDWEEAKITGYFSAVSVSIFALPLVILVILYTRILLRLRRCTQEARSVQLAELGVTEGRNSTASSCREEVTRRPDHLSVRVNLPSGAHSDPSRATQKATNLSLTVVTLFVITNLPYVVDEFIRQGIFGGSGGTGMTAQAIIGMTIVSNSAINPFIFLLFNSTSHRASAITRNCCPLVKAAPIELARSSEMRLVFRGTTLRKSS